MERKEGGKVGTEGGGCVKGVVEGVRQEGGAWLVSWMVGLNSPKCCTLAPSYGGFSGRREKEQEYPGFLFFSLRGESRPFSASQAS